MKELLNETTLRLCMGRISFWQYTFANLPRASTVKREFPRLYSLPLKRGWAPQHKKHELKNFTFHHIMDLLTPTKVLYVTMRQYWYVLVQGCRTFFFFFLTTGLLVMIFQIEDVIFFLHHMGIFGRCVLRQVWWLAEVRMSPRWTAISRNFLLGENQGWVNYQEHYSVLCNAK